MGIFQLLQDEDRHQRERQQGQEYLGLLDSYRVAGDPNTPNPGPYALGQHEMQQAQMQQQGGYRQASGLLGAAPPSDFFTRAAAIGPAYSGLASGAQANIGAMERQQQGQHWESNNMSLAQKTSLDQQYQQQKWARERQEFEYNNLSAAQRGSLGAQYAGLNQSATNADRQFNAQFVPDPNRPGSFMPRPTMPSAPAGYSWTPQGTLTEIPGGAPAQAKQQVLGTLQNSVNTLADIRNQVKNDGTTGIQALSGNVAAVQGAFENAALPIVTKAIMGARTDAPGESDLKRINAQVMDITKLFQTPRTRDKALSMLMEMANEQRPPGTEAIAPQMGQSAYFKTYRSDTGRSRLPAEVKPFNPPGAR